MNIKEVSITLLVLFSLTGCTSYNRQVLKSPSGKLQQNYSVSIKAPRDGRYGTQTYNRSGQMTADALSAGFLKYSPDVKVVPVDFQRIDLLGKRNTYYGEPAILHWEDRATEWSGKPDRIEIKLDVYDAESMSHLSSVVFSGKSKWFTLGGDHPQDLLQKPIEDYLNMLY